VSWTTAASVLILGMIIGVSLTLTLVILEKLGVF
jgi:hypothetical protein